MLRQLVRNSARTPLTRAIQSQTRSLHSPFTVLSTESSATATATAAAAQSASSARPLVSPSTPQSQTLVEAQSAPEESAFDGAKEFDSQSGSRVYVVSYPDPSLGAPFGVRLGAYPVSEPFAQ